MKWLIALMLTSSPAFAATPATVDALAARSAGAANEAGRMELRWRVFEELLSSPRLPGDLRMPKE